MVDQNMIWKEVLSIPGPKVPTKMPTMLALLAFSTR